MIRRPPRSTLDRSSAASDVYKRQVMTTGDMDTVDPALNYETAGGQTVSMVYETLIWYNGKDLSLIHISEPTRPY